MLETEWVLRSIYKFNTQQVVSALQGVAGLETVAIEQSAAFGAALRLCEAGMDFADALHVSVAPGGVEFVTFDKALAKQAASLALEQISAA